VDVQRPPLAVNDTVTTPARTVLPINVVANDIAGTNIINLASVITVPASGALACGGSITNQQDGIVLFTAPNAVPAGGTCTFTYTLKDTSVPTPLTSNVATVTVTITPSVVPLTVNDTATTTTGATVIIPVLANDTITAPATINPLSLAVTPPTGAIAPSTNSGSAAANPTGTVSYTAPATPGTYTFTYTVQNSVVAPATPSTSNVATVTVTVTQGHIAPVAVDDPTATATAGGTTIINVTANDTATAPSAINPASLVVSVPAGNGTAAANANGTVTYTAPSTPGIYTFTYTVKDNFATPATSNVATVTVTVGPGAAPLAIATASPVTSYAVGSGAYNDIITATGGTPPYTFFNPVGGTGLPSGISLFSNGQLFGGGATVPGTYTFNVAVFDSNSGFATKSFTLVVTSGPLAITTATPLPSNLIGGGTYNGIINATGGTGPYTFAITAGALPDGISLFSNGQLFGGGATVAGTYSFTVTVTDGAAATASKAFTLDVL
jgi:hypothetical protein